MATHDLIVIGAGPGGYTAAIRAAQLGMNVACVDEHELLGGTCLRVGCIPSKALLESSELYAQALSGMGEHGVKVQRVELDLPAMHRRKDRIVATLAKGINSLFVKHNITRYVGRARLAGKGRVEVTGASGTMTLRAERVLLATGSEPARLPALEADEGVVSTSTEALSFDSPPQRLVVVGAGYIGLELGSVWRRLGSEVHVVEYAPRILPGADEEVASQAERIFARQGLQFALGVKVTGVERGASGITVRVEGGEPLQCDKVLVAIGRRPNTRGLGLETVGVTPDERGFVPVNDRFETRAEGVYAVGDLIGHPMLAHKAEKEGVACVEGMHGMPVHVDYDAIPAVAYTDPEIASVGKTEEQVKATGKAYRKGIFPFRASGRARTLGSVEGFVKVIADAATDRVLGVHILGPRAGDLIAECAAAISFGASAEDLAHVVHAHPTLSEAIGEAALAVDGRALHV